MPESEPEGSREELEPVTEQAKRIVTPPTANPGRVRVPPEGPRPQRGGEPAPTGPSPGEEP